MDVAAPGDVIRYSVSFTVKLRLELKEDSEGKVYCLAMPQVLELFPFSQGLPGCDELAGTVVGDLLGSGSSVGRVKSAG